MKHTYKWVNKKIAEYEELISGLKPEEMNYKKIKNVWSTTLATLESVKHCMDLELAGHDI